MIDLSKIDAAAKSATPGPWEAAGPSFGDPLPRYLNCVGYVTEDDEFEDVCTAPNEHDGSSTSDMAFIATANPSTVLEMVSMIRGRDAQVAQLQEQNTHLDKVASDLQDLCDRQAKALGERDAVLRQAWHALVYSVGNGGDAKQRGAIDAIDRILNP